MTVEYFAEGFCQQLSKLISGTDATDLIMYRQEGYFNYVVSHENLSAKICFQQLL